MIVCSIFNVISVLQLSPQYTHISFICTLVLYQLPLNKIRSLRNHLLKFFATGPEGLSFYHPGSILVESTFASVGYSISRDRHED